MRYTEVKLSFNWGKIEVKLRLKGVLGFALRTKLEPPFGNHRLQTLGSSSSSSWLSIIYNTAHKDFQLSAGLAIECLFISFFPLFLSVSFLKVCFWLKVYIFLRMSEKGGWKKGGALHGGFGGFGGLQWIFFVEITGLSVDHFGLLRRLWRFSFSWQISSLQFSSSQAWLPLVYFYISDKSGILYKAVLTRRVIVLIDRPVGPAVADILNPPSIPPRDYVLFMVVR